MDRYVCIHGHFYQPPRENPWLEEIETQESAYPFHDWNERIAAECYSTNGASRIVDSEDRLIRIANNYSKISFNFGPTLLSWMAAKDRETYQRILEADRKSQARFSGHGSAMAQAYNHMILPLASSRDKRTQVAWGIRDFESRFQRKPEGMWLAETAVDLESLDIMAEYGIKFTVLAPSQARAIRPLKGGDSWTNVEGARIDPSRAYLQKLPSGRSIALFFYDGPISQAVAFEKLLSNGETFANRLTSGFSEARDWPQLSHIATDGETYGHHHRFGDMALAYALHHIEEKGLAKLTNYGEFLEKFPPTHEVQIIEDTAWSCAHGVERWKSNCGCASGMNQGWNQSWREPLRNALDWLQESSNGRFAEEAGRLLKDPWKAREDYINVILNRSPENVNDFFQKHATRDLKEEERVQVMKLMEMQRNFMLMYTSCGWFFDEISGIETVQCVQYAGRAIQLAEDVLKLKLEDDFKSRLKQARSNVPEIGDGKAVYERFVQHARVDLLEVGAHFAVNSVFEPYSERARIYCYEVQTEEMKRWEAGKATFMAGRSRVISVLTGESLDFSFGVLHFGDHNIAAGVRQFQSMEKFNEVVKEGSEAFNRADFPAVLRILDRNFEGATYSLKSLFRDEQRRVLSKVLASTFEEVDATFSDMYSRYQPLMRFMADANAAIPRVFRNMAEQVKTTELRQALAQDHPDVDEISAHLSDARMWKLQLDAPGLALAYQRTLERMIGRLRADPENMETLSELNRAVDLAERMPFEVNTSRVQNEYYGMLRTTYPEIKAHSSTTDGKAGEWLKEFRHLGELLHVRVE